MSQPIASFLNGLIQGRTLKRQWKAEDEDRAWKKDRQGRQLVLDQQQDEDRLSDNAWEETSRARTQTTWGQQDEDRLSDNAWEQEDRSRRRTVWGNEDHDRRRRIITENLDQGWKEEERDRLRAGYARDDALRADVDAATAAAAEAYASDQAAAAAPAAAAPPARSLPADPAVAPPGDSAAPTPPPSAAQPQTPPPGIDTAPGGLPMPVVPPPAPAPAAATPPPVAPAPTQEPQAIAPARRSLPPDTLPAETQDARAAEAGKTFMQHYRETAVPKIVEAYARAGELEKAKAFDEFARSSQTQEAMGHWSEAVFAAQTGDSERFASALAKAYNVRGYFDDGIVALPDETVIQHDENGRISGKIVFMDEATGKRMEMGFEGADDLYRMGIGMLSPEQVFERGLQQADAAAERRQKIMDSLSKPDDKTEFDRMSAVIEQIEKSPQGMGMSMDEKIAAARAYLKRFDSAGRLLPESEGPAAAEADVPVFLR